MLFKKKQVINVFETLIKKFEGYSSVPYWDVSRWSWGYGTQVPDSISNPSIIPSGTISQQDAMNDAINFSLAQQQTLRNYLKVPLNNNQYAALLSFAYNLGTGNGIKLIKVINTGDMQAIHDYWLEFDNVNGVPNSNLENRRATEFALFEGD